MSDLWKQYQQWQTDCTWVDLSLPLSPTTPHWVGFSELKANEFLNLDESIFLVHEYTTVGQYGTHVDAPNHMIKGARSLDQVAIREMILPLCVINLTDKVAQNADYVLTVSDIEAYEAAHGSIPQNAFVVFQSGWSKRNPKELDNLDAEGNRHFPGWSLEAVEFMVHERNIGGIGHETSDTEAPITSDHSNYEVERYILAQDRIQAELLTNVDQCPPAGALIFITFPKALGGSGFPARCFALCPREYKRMKEQ